MRRGQWISEITASLLESSPAKVAGHTRAVADSRVAGMVIENQQQSASQSLFVCGAELDELSVPTARVTVGDRAAPRLAPRIVQRSVICRGEVDGRPVPAGTGSELQANAIGSGALSMRQGAGEMKTTSHGTCT